MYIRKETQFEFSHKSEVYAAGKRAPASLPIGFGQRLLVVRAQYLGVIFRLHDGD